MDKAFGRLNFFDCREHRDKLQSVISPFAWFRVAD